MTDQRIIGKSPAWVEALDHVSQLAPINRAALVIGERGTGKELVAERLHFLSSRWDQPFIKVNCAAYTDTLLESELFGYEPGAFTGASRLHRGHFERAQDGTLFLDELGTLSPRVQEKVLRIIEYGEFERLGGQKTITVDVRIVAATNANLRAMAATGKFRHDLLDRLAFDVVHLPPLQQRPEDIIDLSDYFAIRMCHELGWELFPGFSPKAKQQLLNYRWPGNVRELKNVVERSVYRWNTAQEPIDNIVTDPFTPPFTPPDEDSIAPNPSADISAQPQSINFEKAVGDFECQLLKSTLKRCQHHQGDTAKQLGLTYNQFRGLYRKYQLGHTQK